MTSEKKGEIAYAVGCGPEYVRLYTNVHAPLCQWIRSDKLNIPGYDSLGEDATSNEELIKTRL